MNQSLRPFLFSLAILFQAVPCLSAEDQPNRNRRFDHLTTRDGLSMGLVTTLIQDAQGYVWIGTQNGLNRFDGIEVRSYFSDAFDASSISHSFVWSLFLDSEEELWVGTRNGVNFFDAKNDSFIRYPFGREVRSIFESRDKTFLFGTTRGLVRWTVGGEIEPLFQDKVDSAVRCLFKDSRGYVWLCTEKNGLVFIKESAGEYDLRELDFEPLNSANIRAIDEDENGGIWVATYDRGVFFVDEMLDRFVSLDGESESPAYKRVRSLHIATNGDVLVGSDLGLRRIDSSSKQVLEEFTGLASQNVNRIMEDSGGVYWLGTFNGVSRTNSRLPAFRWNDTGKHDLFLLSIHQTDAGEVLGGSLRGIVVWTSDFSDRQLFTSADLGIIDPRVSSITTFGGRVWFGTMSNGLYNTSKLGGLNTNSFVYDPSNLASISSNAITDLYVDQDGDLWIATYGNGVNLYLGNGRFRRFPDTQNPEGEFSSLLCLAIDGDRNGYIWVATDGGGVVRLDKMTGNTLIFQKSSDQNSLSSNFNTSLEVTETGVWVGSVDEGLSFISFNDRLVSRIHEDKLRGTPVFGIVEDENRKIWFSDNTGIRSLNTVTGDMQKFDSTHGVQPFGLNGNAEELFSDGSITFGGYGGITVFHPGNVHRSTHIPKLAVTNVEIDNRQILKRGRNGAIVLPMFSKSVDIEFAAMDFVNPSGNKYRYKLEGFDSDWIENGSDRSVTYTNLDPGRYQLKILASNSDGVWNLEGLNVPIRVEHPPWVSWWAYVLYGATALMLFRLFYGWNERRAARESDARSNSRLALYLQSLDETDECVINADEAGKILFVNSTASIILEKSPSETIGFSLFDLVFQSEELKNEVEKTLSSEKRYQAEIPYENAYVDKVLEVSITALPNAKDDVVYVSVIRDVTVRSMRDDEKAAEMMQLKESVESITKELGKTILEAGDMQSELQASKNHQDRLLGGIHERVTSNLQMLTSLLNIQASKVSDEGTLKLLEDNQQRVKAITLVHENIHDAGNLRGVNMHTYLDTLATGLFRRLTPDGINIFLEKDVDEIILNLEQAVPCGLIVNELLSNALAHGFTDKLFGTGNLKLKLGRAGNDCVLSISDDGGGLPMTVSGETTMGIEMVSMLADQLAGDLRRIGGPGTTFEVWFPLSTK